MGLHFFDELNQTNAAYCKALGLDASPYETPLSPDEVLIANERRWLVDRGMTPAKADVWAPINVRQGVSNEPHAVVEYARTDEQIAAAAESFGNALDQFYAACRARTTIGPAFVGD